MPLFAVRCSALLCRTKPTGGTTTRPNCAGKRTQNARAKEHKTRDASTCSITCTDKPKSRSSGRTTSSPAAESEERRNDERSCRRSGMKKSTGGKAFYRATRRQSTHQEKRTSSLAYIVMTGLTVPLSVRVCPCACLCVLSLGGFPFGAPGAQNWAPAYHRLKLTEWTQQGQRPAIVLIGASGQVSRGT